MIKTDININNKCYCLWYIFIKKTYVLHIIQANTFLEYTKNT